MDRANGSTDILDMALVSPNLAIHDIQFQIGDELGSDHLPIEISIDTSPHDIQFQIGDEMGSDHLPLKYQLIHHHIGTHILTTPNTNLTRQTEKYSNQHSRKR